MLLLGKGKRAENVTESPAFSLPESFHWYLHVSEHMYCRCIRVHIFELEQL